MNQFILLTNANILIQIVIAPNIQLSWTSPALKKISKLDRSHQKLQMHSLMKFLGHQTLVLGIHLRSQLLVEGSNCL